MIQQDISRLVRSSDYIDLCDVALGTGLKVVEVPRGGLYVQKAAYSKPFNQRFYYLPTSLCGLALGTDLQHITQYMTSLVQLSLAVNVICSLVQENVFALLGGHAGRHSHIGSPDHTTSQMRLNLCCFTHLGRYRSKKVCQFYPCSTAKRLSNESNCFRGRN